MKEFNKPDLHSPRYRTRTLDILTKEFFKEFKTKYPQYSELSNRELKNKIKLINKSIYQTILNERYGVELPNGLGLIFIGSCPKKISSNTDYVKSITYGKQIQTRNYDSDEFVAKIFYTNYEQKYRFKFHETWGFSGVREFKRSIKDIYKEHWNRFIRVDNFIKISSLFRNRSYKMLKQKEEVELLKEYNDLEI